MQRACLYCDADRVLVVGFEWFVCLDLSTRAANRLTGRFAGKADKWLEKINSMSKKIQSVPTQARERNPQGQLACGCHLFCPFVFALSGS